MGGSIGGQLLAQNTDLPAVTNGAGCAGLSGGDGGECTECGGDDEFEGRLVGRSSMLTATAAGAAAAISVIAASAAVCDGGTGQGSSGNRMRALANLAHATDASGLTMSGALASLLSGVGTRVAVVAGAERDAAGFADAVDDAAGYAFGGDRLMSEAANLSEYQRSYQAAAKLLTVLDPADGDGDQHGDAGGRHIITTVDAMEPRRNAGTPFKLFER